MIVVSLVHRRGPDEGLGWSLGTRTRARPAHLTWDREGGVLAQLLAPGPGAASAYSCACIARDSIRIGYFSRVTLKVGTRKREMGNKK